MRRRASQYRHEINNHGLNDAPLSVNRGFHAKNCPAGMAMSHMSQSFPFGNYALAPVQCLPVRLLFFLRISDLSRWPFLECLEQKICF